MDDAEAEPSEAGRSPTRTVRRRPSREGSTGDLEVERTEDATVVLGADDLADPEPLPPRPEREGRGPITAALASVSGPLLVIVALLVLACFGLLITVVGGRQPAILGTPDPDVVDPFVGEDGTPLGDLPLSEGSWELLGRWEVVAGAAALAELPPSSGRGFALLPGTAEKARVAATFRGLAADSGLVARYQGPNDFIGLFPAPELGTWRLDVVVAGEVAQTDNAGLVGAADGDRAELVVSDDNAWIIINGQVARKLTLTAKTGAGRVGLVAGSLDEGSPLIDDVAQELG